jgi:acetate---CoA ligase (ADP-forming) subunit beta
MTISQKPDNSASRIVSKAFEEGRNSLIETESERVAKLFGIKVPQSRLVSNAGEAVRAAKSIGLPVVMKIVSPDILHKSDVGGVIGNVVNLKQVRSAFSELYRNARRANSKARIEGVLVQKMAPKTSEFVVGAIRDPQFGPTVMFGLGGIYVELFKDVSFRLAPLKKSEALDMMGEVKSAKLLDGFRGSPPLDRNSVASTIVSVGDLMSKLKRVESIDINPLLVYPKGVIAVDVRMILQKVS